MLSDQEKYQRPESYPQPTETDQQLKNQEEYVEQPVTGNNLNSPNPNDAQREAEKKEENDRR
jgi:hypothetical protein